MARDITALALQLYKQYGTRPRYGYGMYGQKWGSEHQKWARGHYPKNYPWRDPSLVTATIRTSPPWLCDCIGWVRILCMHMPGVMEVGNILYATAIPGAFWKNLYNNTNYPQLRTDRFDKSANWCRDNWGAKPIASIPEPTENKAVAVFMDGHIGLYVGGGKVIEMTPPNLMMTTLNKREKGGKWTRWAYVPDWWLNWAENVQVALNGTKSVATPEKPQTKSENDLANEVIIGLWGNGTERKQRLAAAGHNYTAVQKRVNELKK